MVRSGPVVAAAIALLEQQTTTPSAGQGLRRIGAVSVLPHRSVSSTDSDADSSSEDQQRSEEPPSQPAEQAADSEEQLASQDTQNTWTDSVHSASSGSEETTSASASETDDNNREEHNTTGCDEDFQWVQSPEPRPPSQETPNMQDLYSNNTKDPGKPVTFRSKGSLRGSRKDRDNKSKSSSVYRYHSPSRGYYADDILHANSGRNLCFNCSTSCQDIPEHSHRYGSTPGLDCHWLSQPAGCYHCHHRNITPYCCEQLYPPYRYYKSSGDTEELVRRLEADKDRLSLQVTVLTEQIDAQTEKIVDLEKSLDDKKKQLHSADDVLNREMLTRSALETQKLELLALVSELKRQHAVLERENIELRDRLAEERRRNKPPIMPRNSPFPASSTPNQVASRGISPLPSPIIINNSTSPRKITEYNDDIGVQQQSPLGFKRAGDMQYSSLPRQVCHPAPTTGPDTPRKGVAFGRNLMLMRAAGDRSSSVPNLAETESVVINDTVSETDGRCYTPQPSPSPSLQTNKTRGIKKIFGKMKRSGSGNLDDLPGDGEFRRGGVRATAGGRLGWSASPQNIMSEQPFSQWTCQQVCDWLTEMGLECTAEAKRWGKNGAQYLAASTNEIEKELALKNPLHRKKLHLALHCLRGSPTDPYLVMAGVLDTAWVLRWLDDAGLPQHKDTFLAARVDGRLLHRLTLEELAGLHVTSVLHAASIRTGIQVLRNQSFEPNCLVRRSSPEGEDVDVSLWTNHRVMEWLRAVDLAEYAPNLRGSGVHGGLMVYEPRFTGELLASLLSIPPAKTLLRRHLLTHFKELLGRDVIQQKREAEASMGYIPLTTTTKMKVPKKSQFTLKRKKSKSELDYGELVCPLEQSRADDSPGDASLSGKTQNQGDVSHDQDINCSISSKDKTPTSDRDTSV